MDLHLIPGAVATPAERAAIDGFLDGIDGTSEDGVELDGRVVRGGHQARSLRTQLLPALHALQAAVGWISEGGLNYLCERLTVPPAESADDGRTR